MGVVIAYAINEKGTRTCHAKQWPSSPSTDYTWMYLYIFTAISIQIQREQPFFGRYENGWPICSMVQTYLLNSKQTAKRRHAALAQSDDQEEIKGEKLGWVNGLMLFLQDMMRLIIPL